ncbi:MAG TPA: Gfo/Idh/MocA family oxidoreductase [Planctomycetaceae bacterium]|nr:Gfo/Idh/MocA family oxidoreductase [Planctomycetaceae bacterium]
MRHVNRRVFIGTAISAGAATTLPFRSLFATNANEEISLGFISCGGRAGQLMKPFSRVPGVNIAGLCDPDEDRLASAKQRYPKARTWTHLRGLIEDDSIDAVVIATCNHWHCLAAIWAMEAGKDVYVEKPLSHSQWEGRQTVAAARKYGKICQLGTQQRSAPMQAEIKKFLHDEKALGNILSARVNRFGVRGSIGKRTTPLAMPKNVDYDVWLGPAQSEPIYRDKLHYDWHWDFNTGSGEMGNWGVHVLDDLRNNIFQDQVSLPKRILGGGGRVVYNDAGETPNVHFCYFDTGGIPVVIALSNLTAGTSSKDRSPHPGPNSGYMAFCEGGRFEGQRGRAEAFDKDGKSIKKFKGTSGMGLHQQNFIDAMRKRDSSMLNADVQVGHDSTGWCNLANVSYLSGQPFSFADAKQIGQDSPLWSSVLGDMAKLLKSHGLDIERSEIKLSPLLTVDPKTEQFVGSNSETANQFLKREYRKGYEVPEIVS